MNRRFFSVVAVAAVALMVTNPLASTSQAGGLPKVIQTATLKPAVGLGKLKGKAKSTVKGTQAEFEVELENAKKLAGTQVTVRVDGVSFGSVTVNALGKANLSLNTGLGHSVPSVSPGTVVIITDAGGNTILSGTF